MRGARGGGGSRGARVALISLALLVACDEDVELVQRVPPLVDGVDAAPPAGCFAVGLDCENSGDCCSGLCEFGLEARRTCADACRPAGASCTRSIDCCTFGCDDGRCSIDEECRETNRSCNEDAECCTNYCSAGQCQLRPGMTCQPPGDGCENAPEPCCSGRCEGDRCTRT